MKSIFATTQMLYTLQIILTLNGIETSSFFLTVQNFLFIAYSFGWAVDSGGIQTNFRENSLICLKLTHSSYLFY